MKTINSSVSGLLFALSLSLLPAQALAAKKNGPVWTSSIPGVKALQEQARPRVQALSQEIRTLREARNAAVKAGNTAQAAQLRELVKKASAERKQIREETRAAILGQIEDATLKSEYQQLWSIRDNIRELRREKLKKLEAINQQIASTKNKFIRSRLRSRQAKIRKELKRINWMTRAVSKHQVEDIKREETRFLSSGTVIPVDNAAPSGTTVPVDTAASSGTVIPDDSPATTSKAMP